VLIEGVLPVVPECYEFGIEPKEKIQQTFVCWIGLSLYYWL